MKRSLTILLLSVIFLSFSRQEKYLKIPTEGIKKVNLVLKDQFSGSVIEEYELSNDKHSLFINDLNKAPEAPNLKMNITCYRFDILYQDGRKVQISTNGKGLGPTPVGYFLSSENLISKYFPITKERYCKPTKGGGGAKRNVGF